MEYGFKKLTQEQTAALEKGKAEATSITNEGYDASANIEHAQERKRIMAPYFLRADEILAKLPVSEIEAYDKYINAVALLETGDNPPSQAIIATAENAEKNYLSVRETKQYASLFDVMKDVEQKYIEMTYRNNFVTNGGSKLSLVALAREYLALKAKNGGVGIHNMDFQSEQILGLYAKETAPSGFDKLMGDTIMPIAIGALFATIGAGVLSDLGYGAVVADTGAVGVSSASGTAGVLPAASDLFPTLFDAGAIPGLSVETSATLAELFPTIYGVAPGVGTFAGTGVAVADFLPQIYDAGTVAETGATLADLFPSVLESAGTGAVTVLGAYAKTALMPDSSGKKTALPKTQTGWQIGQDVFLTTALVVGAVILMAR